MTKSEALAIFATAIIRELVDDETPGSVDEVPRETPAEPSAPQPRFDFDESNDVCEHNGVYIQRATCPIHGPNAQADVSPEDLDSLTGEQPELHRRQRKPRVAPERLFPEDIPMSGLGPPDDLP